MQQRRQALSRLRCKKACLGLCPLAFSWRNRARRHHCATCAAAPALPQDKGDLVLRGFSYCVIDEVGGHWA